MSDLQAILKNQKPLAVGFPGVELRLTKRKARSTPTESLARPWVGHSEKSAIYWNLMVFIVDDSLVLSPKDFVARAFIL